MSKGRAVHQGKQKIALLATQMFRAGRIEKSTVEAFAEKSGINLPALKRAMQEESFSPEMEENLRLATGMDPTRTEWVDLLLSDDNRNVDHTSEYAGRDTLASFQEYLNEILPARKATSTSAPAANVTATRPWTVDKNLVCHDITLAQANDGPHLELRLQADFGWRYQDKIKYVLRRVRLDVTIGCSHGFAKARLGRSAPFDSGTVRVTGRGTDQQPIWVIVPANDEVRMLEGSHEIMTPPLASLCDLRAGAQISSKMQVNIHDCDIEPEADLPRLTGAQATLIERVFMMDFGQEDQETGWLTLSRHDVTIAGDK